VTVAKNDRDSCCVAAVSWKKERATVLAERKKKTEEEEKILYKSSRQKCYRGLGKKGKRVTPFRITSESHRVLPSGATGRLSIRRRKGNCAR